MNICDGAFLLYLGDFIEMCLQMNATKVHMKLLIIYKNSYERRIKYDTQS